GPWETRPWGEPQREAPVDYSQAPRSAGKKPDATTTIVVVGDANADWLAYGLEDAFAENPEIGVVRKHRTDSGLIRYDQRRDAVEWPQAAREIIAAEKPKFIVMMIGNNDRQPIREKAPAAKPGAGNAKGAQPKEQAAPPPGAVAAAAGRRRAAAARAVRGAACQSHPRAGASVRLRAVGIPHREVGARLYPARRRHHRRAQEHGGAGVLGGAAVPARPQ